MAPMLAAMTRNRPVTSTPGRPRSGAPQRNARNTDRDRSEGPPLKKRRYISGGPVESGRYIDAEGAETRAASLGLGSRPRREHTGNSSQPPPTTPPSTRPRRDRTRSRARYSSATAAALALQQGDGYKPREERGWEEFHPDLDTEAKFVVFSSDEVDGVVASAPVGNGELRNGTNESGGGESAVDGIPNGNETPNNPPKRRPGRPFRRVDPLLNGIVTPDEPKTVPPPGPNPRERLTLPKPIFYLRDPFVPFEQKGVGHQNYVDRTMASVGYQESDMFIRHDRRLIRVAEGALEEDLDLSPPPTDGESNAAIGSVGVGRVEYDMDEQDEKWLEDYNTKRREDQLEPIKPAVFEITMTKIEKEWHALEKRIPKPNPKPPQTQRPRSSSAAAVNGEPIGSGEEQDSKCAVCDDGDCENSNAIVFCDGCDLAVHQECYGVPYIPEGQWLCRKCQLIGRGSPNCIFCPNSEGAFKQTTTSKWSHLLCAIWIPEVGIGNPSLMEPVTDVEKVPKSRWKLLCYICKQRMGASIQCSNKNCFVAFHVTCARKAQLYLKMKTGHGNPAIMDSNLLKAFCDKHVPPDWRKEHGTDAAYAEAVEYYKTAMQGKRWGDSQAAALALGPSYAHDPVEPCDDSTLVSHSPRLTITVSSNRRKRPVAPKTIWKLPSGAPVIPQVVLNSVVASLQRFSVRQRKQYAEDACKYWTLKREARRGAALLKRLQLQLETFSSMEMTRRNFIGMGPIGRSRLQRRIDFAERLSFDVDRLRILCDEVKKRERERLKDAELLRSIVDTVYLPVPSMLWPIFDKAYALDGKGVYRQGLLSIRSKLEERCYTTVSTFSADLARVFTTEIGVQHAGDTAELQMQISGRAPELSAEQREKRKLAKRIIKAIQPALEEAIKQESELSGKPFEKELKELDLILETSVLSRRASTIVGLVDRETPERRQVSNDVREDHDGDQPATTKGELIDALTPVGDWNPVPVLPDVNGVKQHLTERGKSIGANVDTVDEAPNRIAEKGYEDDDQQLPLAQGGIPWYMQPFDPIGTTIHEERWTGRDVMRGMSEELSELDEDELEGLVDMELEGVPDHQAQETLRVAPKAPVNRPVAKASKPRKRWRGFK